MYNDPSAKILLTQEALSILNQVSCKLDNDDYFSAQVMIGVVRHLLEVLQTDLEKHLTLERQLKNILHHDGIQ